MYFMLRPRPATVELARTLQRKYHVSLSADDFHSQADLTGTAALLGDPEWGLKPDLEIAMNSDKSTDSNGKTRQPDVLSEV